MRKKRDQRGREGCSEWEESMVRDQSKLRDEQARKKAFSIRSGEA